MPSVASSLIHRPRSLDPMGPLVGDQVPVEVCPMGWGSMCRRERRGTCLLRRGSRVRAPSTPPTIKQTRAFAARVSFRLDPRPRIGFGGTLRADVTICMAVLGRRGRLLRGNPRSSSGATGPA